MWPWTHLWDSSPLKKIFLCAHGATYPAEMSNLPRMSVTHRPWWLLTYRLDPWTPLETATHDKWCDLDATRYEDSFPHEGTVEPKDASRMWERLTNYDVHSLLWNGAWQIVLPPQAGHTNMWHLHFPAAGSARTGRDR